MSQQVPVRKGYMGFPKITGTVRVPMLRVVMSCGLGWGPPIEGKNKTSM